MSGDVPTKTPAVQTHKVWWGVVVLMGGGSRVYLVYTHVHMYIYTLDIHMCVHIYSTYTHAPLFTHPHAPPPKQQDTHQVITSVCSSSSLIALWVSTWFRMQAAGISTLLASSGHKTCRMGSSWPTHLPFTRRCTGPPTFWSLQRWRMQNQKQIVRMCLHSRCGDGVKWRLVEVG